MIFPVPITLFLLCITPIDSIPLTTACHTVYVYKDTIFCAPFTGNSIFALIDRKEMRPMTFTDSVNYRIHDIAVTPFSVYLNNGQSIEKYYFGSGIKETVFRADDITSFIITRTEEIILSDRLRREVIFLDFEYAPRFTIDDISVRDMFYADTTIYLLLQNRVLQCDEYGNLTGETPVPIGARRIFAYGSTILIFSPGDRHLYSIADSIRNLKLRHGVRDIAEHNNYLVVLDNYGTTLFVYRKSAF